MQYLVTFLVGFVCASPIGPMGLLCLRRTLSCGLRSSLSAIAGIALADSAWAFIALNGMRSLSGWLAQQQQPIGIAVGLLFIWLGIHGLRDRHHSLASVDSSLALAGFVPNFAVVFFNPSTVVLFSGVFALTGITGLAVDKGVSLLFALSVFLGVISFWALLGAVSVLLRGSLQVAHMQLISRIISALIALIGAAMLVFAIAG